MRPKKLRTTTEGDLFRARLDQIINMKHELVQLAARIDWDWIDREVAPLYSDNGRPGIETRFVIGLLLLKHIYGLSDERPPYTSTCHVAPLLRQRNAVSSDDRLDTGL
jgi:IS5 family transposase